MAKKKATRKQTKRSTATKRRKSVPRQPKRPDPLTAAVRGAERREVGHVRLEVGRAGAARVKRMVYPAGFRWSVDMKPIVGTDLCMHCLLYTSDAADERSSVDLGGRRIIKKKKKKM